MFLEFEFVYMNSNYSHWSFPGGSVVKNLTASAGNLGSIPESGGSPGEGNDNLLQYSCLENPMGRGAWQTTYSPLGL